MATWRPDRDLLARRTRAQWLAGRPGTSVEQVAAHTLGLQAQEPAATRFAVRARSQGLTAARVRDAYAAPTVARTWLMRGTLHLVAAADVRWLLTLFGARNAAATRTRRAGLGLDDETCARALDALPAVLSGGPLSRAELVSRLSDRGIRIQPSGQAPAHLVYYAAACGLICRGPDVARDEPGYVLLDDWLPAGPVLDEEVALAELARRYLAAYGPAGAADLAAWSGLPLGTARRAVTLVAAGLVELAPDRWVPATAAPAPDAGAPVVRLLGGFDTYLLGYRDRADALDPRYGERVHAGGGIIRAAVLVDGRVTGTWRLERSGDVRIEPFGRLDPALRPALDAEIDDVRRFVR